MNFSLSKVINFHLFGLLLILPFLAVLKEMIPILSIGDNTLIGFSKELLAFSLIVFLCYALFDIAKYQKVNIQPFDYILLFFIFWNFLHILIGMQDLNQKFNGFRLQLLYPTIFILLLLILNSKKSLYFENIFEKVIKIFLFQSVLVLLFAYVEIVYPDILLVMYRERYSDMISILGIPGKENIRIVSFLGNPINLGLYLTLAFIFFIHLFKTKKQNILIFIIYILIFLGPLFLTFSRTSYGIFIFILLLSYANLIYNKPFAGTFSLAFFIVFLTFVFLLFFNDFIEYIELILYRLGQFSDFNVVSSDPRIENSKYFLMSIFSQGGIFYFWGGGLGLSDPSYDAENSFSAENAYITILAEQGIGGVFLFSLIILRFFYNIFKMIKSKRIILSNYGITLFYVLIWFLMASMTSDTIKNNPFSFYFWFFFFIGEYYTREKIAFKN